MIDHWTAALHADDPLAELPDISPALRPSTTFQKSLGGRIYRRDGDETSDRLEAVLGALEGGHSTVFPSGMAAVAAILRWVRPQRVALPEDIYHGIAMLVERGVAAGDWNITDPEMLEAGDLWWVETPSNPKCLITDLTAIARAAAPRGVVTAVDATFATPVLQETLSFGVDFSMHATTKFIGGHSDAMGGVVSTRDESIATALRRARHDDGSVPGALETWLTLRGVRTLPLRIQRQSATALEVARFLAGKVPTVWYPGLRSHPGHEVAARQMSAFGGILSFEVESAATAATVVSRLSVFRNATSLGGVESLVEHRLDSDPSAPPGLIRLSVGLEDPAALIADLENAVG